MTRKIFLNPYTRILAHENRVILGNRKNGQWLKISKECKDILEYAITQQMTDDDLLDCFEDTEDRRYFSELLNQGVNNELLTENPSEPFKSPKIDIAITHRCNLACIHCCVDASSLAEKDVLSTSDLKELLYKVVACHPEGITFTGGEPLVRRDFFEILSYLHKIYSGEIRLMTNATLINSENVQTLCRYISAVDISLDGVDEESCAIIRGPGVFDKVIQAVRLLQKYGLNNISISMVMTKTHSHLYDKFIKLNKELGTRAVPRIFSPIGRGKKNARDLGFGGDRSLAFKNTSIEEQEETLDDLHICRCGAIRETIYINYNGNIFPCGLAEKEEYNLGNIMEISDFRSYLEHKEYRSKKGYKNWLDLQPENYEHCKDCDVNLFCWHCLHQLDLLKDDPTLFQKECERKRMVLNEMIWGNDICSSHFG